MCVCARVCTLYRIKFSIDGKRVNVGSEKGGIVYEISRKFKVDSFKRRHQSRRKSRSKPDAA